MVDKKKKVQLKVVNTDEILKLSCSGIKTYEQCPRKWYFTYLDKPAIPEKDWSHLTLGNFVHDVLELFHNILIETPNSNFRKLMSHSCKELEKEYSVKLTPEIIKDIKALLLAYLDMLETKGLPNVESNEMSFSVMLEEKLLIRGKIDRIDMGYDEFPEIPHIVDYKSGKSKYLDEFQLLVYGIPLLKNNPNVESYRGSYLVLKENMKWISNTFTKTDVENVKEKIRKIAASIKTDRTWEPRPQFLCNWCDYESVCDSAPSNKKFGGKAKPFINGAVTWE